MSVASVAYPYNDSQNQPMGYCSTADVLGRIKQGRYLPDAPGSIGSDYIEQFITQAAAQIDMTLAATGYFVPITPRAGSSIGAQVWTLLKWVNATGAASYVEMWRHAEDTTSQDTQADHLYEQMFMDHLDKIAKGKLHGSNHPGNGWNLALAPFNLDGPFVPQSDPQQAMDSGEDDLDWRGLTPSPLFTIVPGQAGGTPQTTADGDGNTYNPLTTW